MKSDCDCSGGLISDCDCSVGERLEIAVKNGPELMLNGVPMVRKVLGGDSGCTEIEGKMEEGDECGCKEGRVDDDEFVYDYYWVDPSEASKFEHAATRVNVDLVCGPRSIQSAPH